MMDVILQLDWRFSQLFSANVINNRTHQVSDMIATCQPFGWRDNLVVSLLD